MKKHDVWSLIKIHILDIQHAIKVPKRSISGKSLPETPRKDYEVFVDCT
jgi:hypothetical protein